MSGWPLTTVRKRLVALRGDRDRIRYMSNTLWHWPIIGCASVCSLWLILFLATCMTVNPDRGLPTLHQHHRPGAMYYSCIVMCMHGIARCVRGVHIRHDTPDKSRLQTSICRRWQPDCPPRTCISITVVYLSSCRSCKPPHDFRLSSAYGSDCCNKRPTGQRRYLAARSHVRGP